VFQFLAQDFAQGADGHRRAALSERCAQCFVDQCLITLAFLFRTPAECLQNRIVQINRDARLAGRREHRAAQRLTATQDRDTLVTNAKTDFGHFLAVKYLLPVAIEGSSAVLSTIHTDLYAQWESDKTARAAGGIDLNFTDAYLADRSAFLTWKNHLALRDRSAAAAPYTDAPDAWFRDYATSLTIHLGATTTDSTAKPRYLFGADQTSGTEMLEGGTNADRIYGGGGVDHLHGHGGRDWLEGGAGDDRLEGGRGFDTYIVGQGTDTIVDEDGLGVIKDGQGRILAGAFLQGADGRYSWAGNPAVTATHNSPLTITLENGAQVVIDNYDTFADGELGGVSRYEFADGAVLDHAQLMAEAQSDGLGLTGSGAADRLIGSRAADSLSGGAGADVLQGQGGDDAYLFNLGDGQDRIDDPEGRNVLRFGPGIAPASVSLVNYPEGWSLLAYGDQGDALRIEAGVLGAGKTRSAGYGDKSRSARGGGNDESGSSRRVGGICSELIKRRQHQMQSSIHFH
jgi:Ca2+-binding RTX toxin-like protein